MIKTEHGIYHRESWENHCNTLLRMKYGLKFQAIPAATGGDYGIEGFTEDGIVFQCYCPDEEYEPKALFEHQRDKITRDLKKLEKNKKELKDLLQGTKIKCWIFLTPLVRSKELIKHSKIKAKEYKDDIELTELLDSSFNILVHSEDDYLLEIRKKNNLIDEKIYFDIMPPVETEIIDWKNCADSSIIATLDRKIKKLFPDDTEPERNTKINKVIDVQIRNFIKGQNILDRMKINYAAIYEKQTRVKSSIATGLEMDSLLHEGSKKELLKQAFNDYIQAMKHEKLDIAFEHAVLNDLAHEAVASWLMECLLDF